MIEWIRTKLNLWMKESEILIIIEYFGGEIMKISNILEKFTAAKLEKCREIFVSKEEILLFLIEEWEKLQSSQIDSCEVLKTFNNFQEFQAEIYSYGKNFAEDELKKAFFELIIRKDWRKVLRKYEIIDRVGFKVDEIKRFEKKMLKKPKSVVIKQQKT